MIHRRSKISRLPEPVRTQINEFLDANLEYARILDWLRERGHSGIEHYHLSRWRDTGYQDWLQAQEHQAEFQRKLHWAEQHATSQSHRQLHKAALSPSQRGHVYWACCPNGRFERRRLSSRAF